MLVVLVIYCVVFPSKHLGIGAGKKTASVEEGYGSSELVDAPRR